MTYKDLGQLISVDADTFRMAMKRESFSELRKEKLKSIIRGEHSSVIEKKLSISKNGVEFSIDEVLFHIINNIKSINEVGKLKPLISAINSVNNIDDYNSMRNEITKIKELLEKNKKLLQG
ncbi:hypothetical protein [uncultured Tenacibaculum sp.]|uniref:hypothetical protein n=1 Tax=uncultured Tenacibaculum sp. TaxID=174713 RepID=UPI00260D9A5A|nr:hypothetical protein [uncultured Tenacibaculum sp.]